MNAFLLDTNAISEPMRARPAAAVLDWIEAHEPARMFLSAITVGELVAGIRRLASSARRRELERWLAETVVPQFSGRILSFDPETAWHWGALVAESAAAGRPRPAIDLQIAAIALQHDLVLVTRNSADFERLGLDVVNPWLRRA